MEKHIKQQILHNCNSSTFTIDVLDRIVLEGHITIQEFKNYNLEISKVNELETFEAKRNGTYIPEEEENEYDSESDDTFIPNSFTSNGVIGNQDEKIFWIEKILDKSIDVEKIIELINNHELTYEDLISGGVDNKIVNSLKHFAQPALIRSYKVNDLPTMEEGRTDLFFIGVPAAGKSTMLAGLMKYVHKEGIVLADSYNTAGNVYQEYLIKGIDRGMLPRRTTIGSYNYIATSVKDSKENSHPFNIVEVPGENYKTIFKEGFGADDTLDFVKYIKNKNKKILIFVIDSLAHHKKNEIIDDSIDQSIAYVNILTMFKDYGVLKNVDAIYLVANKFDAIMQSKYMFRNEDEKDLAKDFLEEEFRSLITNCKNARDTGRNKFAIKIFPFSIGSVSYGEILTHYEQHYSKVIMDNLLEDSFVVKGGRFWKF